MTTITLNAVQTSLNCYCVSFAGAVFISSYDRQLLQLSLFLCDVYYSVVIAAAAAGNHGDDVQVRSASQLLQAQCRRTRH